MDNFCGGTSWRLTDDADVSRCIEQSVLAWTPCVFIWLLSPLELHYLVTSKATLISRNPLNISKIVTSVLLCVVAVVDLVTAIVLSTSEDNQTHNVDFVTPAIQLVTFVLSCVLLEYNRRRGLTSSGILFQFWLLCVVCGALGLRTLIKQPQDERGVQWITYLVHLALCVVVLLLDCWADRTSATHKHQKICPERSVSFLSRLTYAWFDKMAVLGHQRSLEINDLWYLDPRERSESLVPLFDKYWERSLSQKTKQRKPTPGGDTQTKKQYKVSILPALCKAFGPSFLLGSFLKVLTDLNGFLNPVILQLLISFSWSDAPAWQGYMYAVLLFVNVTFTTVVMSQYFQRMFTVGLRIRAALISAIFRKSLRLSTSARQATTTGELVNLMSVDAQRFMDLIMYFNMVWSNPLQFSLCFYLLWLKLGPSVLAGLAVLLLLIPVDVVIAGRVRSLQGKQMQSKDTRVKLISEILNGIKVIKLQAWEKVFADKVLEVRDTEVGLLKHSAYYDAANSFIWSFAPILVSLASFATFVLSSEENILDAETAFVSLTLFNMMRYSLTMFPVMITSLVQVSVSVERLNKFMNLPELDPSSVSHNQHEDDPLVMQEGTFTWTLGELPVLKDITMRCKSGSLVAVLGGVGAGKSSLLAACLGDMEKLRGTVNTKGSIAYVPQVAWILNASLRDNILFGKDFEEVTYDRVLEVCALKPDVRILPAGDLTEIGEKGINLSGGQKQRVSLARALYSDADLVLLDDPLSAVDAHVANHIFRHVIGPQGILKNKTRVVVTHGVSWLHEADHVIVLKDGEISESGTFDELTSRSGQFAEFMQQHRGQTATQRVSEETDEDQVEKESPAKKGNEGEKKLTEAEKVEEGKVKWSVYKHYCVSVGVALTVSTLVFNVMYQVMGVASNLWLSVWATKQTGNSTQQLENTEFFLGIYGAFGAAQALFVLLPCVTLVIATVGAAVRLHQQMLHHTLHNPMSFFETTPAGRVINRFSRDVDVVDNTLPVNIRTWLNSFFSVVATLVVISMTNNYFMVLIVPIGFLYYYIQRFYIPSSRQLKRLESVTRSPIYSHFDESVTGTSSIRAYACENRFAQTSEQKVDSNQMPYYLSIIANRWLAIRLEMLGNVIILLAALLAVMAREQMSPGMVGLSISYALQITATLNFLVRVTSDVETNIVAVERIKEFGETPQEAVWETKEGKPASNWPPRGEIKLADFQMRYREGTELVLRGISCTIRPGQKVGVVGRTGAGKSSLALSLFRLVEASHGSIVIDGIDISSLGLHDLRPRLTMIPQDPVLFSGTLRSNLDPREGHDDVTIWRVLELTHLVGVVRALPAGLQHHVTEGGANLSAGQRQLVCLARALLVKSKILVLDEATGAVDLDTDDLVQKTIREEFKESTVLTIAHRLNTILDYDRVLVLDEGHVIEDDTPPTLLQTQTSVFYSMAKQAGIVK